MSAAAEEHTRVTLEEYGRMSSDDDQGNVELVRGMLVREPGPAPIHGRFASRIAHILERYHDERGVRGAVMVNAAFVLAEEPATVRIPDVSYVAPEHMPAARYAERWWRVGPDLAVEVTSPSNSWTQIQQKVQDCLEAGTRMVWVIDPPTCTVTVYRPGEQAARLGAGAELSGEAVLPGLRIPLAELFDL
jgi:Uma2 family endonuclease